MKTLRIIKKPIFSTKSKPHMRTIGLYKNTKTYPDKDNEKIVSKISITYQKNIFTNVILKPFLIFFYI